MNQRILVCGLDIYEARDRRKKGRFVQVIGINCVRNKIMVRDLKGRRTTYINPSRFIPTSTGFRLVTRGTGITLYSSEGFIAAASSTTTASSGSLILTGRAS